MKKEDIRLLYIEDNPDQADGMSLLFNAELGFCCVTEPTLERGIERIGREEINTVILDWELENGITGKESIPAIKEIAPLTSLIILTGYDDEETMRLALQLGADEYLIKPLSPRDLIRKIYEVTLAKHEQLFGKVTQ